jgi:hypothetical protein
MTFAPISRPLGRPILQSRLEQEWLERTVFWVRRRKVDEVESNAADRDLAGIPFDAQPADERVSAKFPVRTHRVAVLLSQERIDARPTDGYEPLNGYIKAIDFGVDATSPLAACEIAYAVTHSSADEMHCDLVYREVVTTYRDVGHFRSVTVNDLLEIDGVRYACARFGFTLVPA